MDLAFVDQDHALPKTRETHRQRPRDSEVETTHVCIRGKTGNLDTLSFLKYCDEINIFTSSLHPIAKKCAGNNIYLKLLRAPWYP